MQHRRLNGARALVLALAAATSPALAQQAPRNGYDADIDLVRPFFTPDILPGIDIPVNERPGTVRAGAAIQYTLEPLVLYQFEQEVGAVVKNRASVWLGGSADITRAITVRASLPMHFQFGTEVPRYAAEGYAVGDLALGAHYILRNHPKFSVGARTDVMLPTSRRNFYAGEAVPRFEGAVLLAATAGGFRWATDLGVNARFRNLVTTEDLVLGSELVWNNGFRYEILKNQLSAGLSTYTRFGFSDFGGPEETSGEALVTVGWRPLPILNVTLSGGRGFTKGYGSSDARVYVGVELRRLPPVVEEPDELTDPNGQNGSGTGDASFKVTEIDRILAGEAPPLELEDKWEEGELSRVNTKTQRIEIRETIRFVIGKEALLPESLPVLDSIAQLMNADATIGNVIIEGHASEDGEFQPNYELSFRRAKSIWERLVQQGVHPQRLAVRGMGEVQPAEANANYDQLQNSRRVVFHIVKQHDIIDVPTYPTELKYPWNGEAYKLEQPKMPTGDVPATSSRPTTSTPSRPPPTRTDEDEPIDFGSDDDADTTPAEDSP
jgi:outer membrane protein OmpA-like peptidoglycan-associated protein